MIIIEDDIEDKKCGNKYVPVAQLEELSAFNRKVVGASPIGNT